MSEAVQFDWRPEPALLFQRAGRHFLGRERTDGEQLASCEAAVRRKVGSRTLIPVSSLRAFVAKDHPTSKPA